MQVLQPRLRGVQAREEVLAPLMQQQEVARHFSSFATLLSKDLVVRSLPVHTLLPSELQWPAIAVDIAGKSHIKACCSLPLLINAVDGAMLKHAAGTPHISGAWFVRYKAMQPQDVPCWQPEKMASWSLLNLAGNECSAMGSFGLSQE